MPGEQGIALFHTSAHGRHHASIPTRQTLPIHCSTLNKCKGRLDLLNTAPSATTAPRRILSAVFAILVILHAQLWAPRTEAQPQDAATLGPHTLQAGPGRGLPLLCPPDRGPVQAWSLPDTQPAGSSGLQGLGDHQKLLIGNISGALRSAHHHHVREPCAPFKTPLKSPCKPWPSSPLPPL